jgi:predicted nucleic acid-binding protein
MAVKVVDASAIGALLFGEPFEVASICRKKLQRHGVQRHVILMALAMFGDMDIERIEIHLPGILSLAEQTRLTIYDASYLWLAGQAKAELVTLDQKLAAAAL